MDHTDDDGDDQSEGPTEVATLDDLPEGNEHADLGGKDSHAARDLIEQAPQERGPDGRFGSKDPRKPRATVAEDPQIEIRSLLKEESGKRDEHGNLKPKPAATEKDGDEKKPIDGKAAKGKDQGASKDPAEKKADRATDEDAPESKSNKTTRKAIADARQVLKLEKWSDDEIADLPEKALLAAAKHASERNAETDRKLREAKQSAKAAKDPGKQARATEADEDADADDKDEVQALTDYADEAFGQGWDDESGNFRKALTKHTGRVIAHMRKEHAAALVEVQEHLGNQFRQILGDVVEELNFKLGSRDLRARYGQHMKDKASLDSLRATAKALMGKHGSYEESLNAAARALWAEEAVKSTEERQKKIDAAKKVGTASPTSRTSARKAPDEMDDQELIRSLLRTG